MIQIGVTLLVSIVLAAGVSANDTRTISLRYDAGLAKGDFPNPAAHLTVNGQSAWFLFDTGVGVHMVASWFADAVGLKTDEAFGEEVQGIDSTGRAVAFRGLRDLVARVDDGNQLTLAVAAVADFPPEFRQFRIGGALSPQLLADPGQAAALDMRVPELRIEAFEQSVRRLGARRLPRDQVQVCGSTKDPVPNLVFAIGVSAGGRKGTMALDTGAGVTKLVAQSALLRGVRLASGGETTGLAGKPQPYRLARGLRITFGDYHATVDARVVNESRRRCGADGLLGLDAIGRCAIVLSEKDLAIACGSQPVSYESHTAPTQDEPSGFAKVLPSDIKWIAEPAAPGVEVAILLGDPAKPGPFVVRVRLPGEVRVMPHTHPVERTYTVLTGEWKLGFGETYDPAQLKTFPAGSIYRLPAHVAHFQATGPGETIIQIHAVGPSTTDFLNPADDPRLKQR
jgi:Aspartyl protease